MAVESVIRQSYITHFVSSAVKCSAPLTWFHKFIDDVSSNKLPYNGKTYSAADCIYSIDRIVRIRIP